MTSSLPNYNEISNALTNADCPFGAAQVHGLFCGYIIAATGDPSSYWEKLLFKHPASTETREILKQLYEMSYHLMNEFSFEFNLLLPDDDTDINLRTEALGLWCQGFLAGLEQFKIPIYKREPSEVTDSLNDILEIAQVNFGEMADNEDDETAYFELVEYTRLAVLLIFQELRKDQDPVNTGELH